MSKLLKYFYKRILLRKSPHTLISWRFIVPLGLADKKCQGYLLHKKVFFNAWQPIPRWLYGLAVVYSILSWYIIFGPWLYVRHFYRKTKHGSKQTETIVSISPHYLRKALRAYSRGITPQSFHSLALYNVPLCYWWCYVPNQVLPHWHQTFQAAYSNRTAKIMSSKLFFANSIDVSSVPTQLMTVDSLANLVPGNDYFFKPEVSSQAKGCFILTTTKEGLFHLTSKDGVVRIDGKQAAIDYLLGLSNNLNYLQQPRLVMPPEFADVCDNDEVVVVRVVTLKVAGRFMVWRANVELPISGKVFIRPYAINVDSGAIPQLDGKVLQEWQAIKMLVSYAHQQVIDLNAVGWDVALTDKGPLLLEGNINWGTNLMQSEKRGGLVDAMYLQMIEGLNPGRDSL